MKRKTGLVAVLLLSLPVLALAGSEGGAVKGSRAPYKGCVWKKLSDPKLGVELVYQKCDYGFRTLDFEVNYASSAVFEVLRDTAPKGAVTRNPLVYVYAKAENESPEAALKRVFYPAMTAEQQRRCIVKREKEGPRGKGKAAYSIVPDDAYDKEIMKKSQGDIPEPPCGEYGMSYDSRSYFEFHDLPGQRKHFALLELGQEEYADFDEQSLRFLP
jgi:hypothetical protein